jgi:hypothetical protein
VGRDQGYDAVVVKTKKMLTCGTLDSLQFNVIGRAGPGSLSQGI